jgi:competence protein ComEC
MMKQMLQSLPLVLVMLAAGTGLSAVKEQTLDIYWIDSEGGGSTLIVTPTGESVLIDSGNPGGRDPKRIFKVAAEVAGLKNIDHLVTTHFDIDHFGGAAELSELIPLGQVYDNGSSASEPGNLLDKSYWPDLIKPYRAFKAAGRQKLNPGDDIKLKQLAGAPALHIRCVGARKQFVAPAAGAMSNTCCGDARLKAVDVSDNANSIVLILEYGNFRFFDGADLTWNMEGELVCPTNRLGQVDVAQVDHHGLDLSNNPMLFRSLNPTVTVMCNGPRKGAASETLATLRAVPSIQTMYQLHRNVRSQKDNTEAEFIANMDEKCEANYIALSVAPSGQSYTISIPARGHRKTFATRIK